MLLEAVVKIQTETGGEEKGAAAATEWKLESLSSHRFRCCLHCIVCQPPPSPQGRSRSFHNATHEEDVDWRAQPPSECAAAGYEFKQVTENKTCFLSCLCQTERTHDGKNTNM